MATPETYLSLFGEIPEFPEKLSTCRKYNISATIILQDISQLQAMYQDQWKTIMANCDNTVFLGNSEPDTLEYYMKKLGTGTITATASRGRSYGKSGSASTTTTQTKREVMTAEEIGRLPDDECLVFLRGARPYRGKKFEYTLHENYELTGDAKPFRRFAYDKNPAYMNQLLSEYDSTLMAKAEIQIEDESKVSTAKTAEFLQSDEMTINNLLDNVAYDEEDEDFRYFNALSYCREQIKTKKDKQENNNMNAVLLSVKNLPSKYLTDILSEIATPEERIVLMSDVQDTKVFCACTTATKDAVDSKLCTVIDNDGDSCLFFIEIQNKDEFSEKFYSSKK